MMSRKGAVIWLSFVLVFSFIVIIVKIAPVVEAPTIWYVDDVAGSGGPGDPPEDFTSIQDAINASQPGDTVFVYNGTYIEHLTVNKTIDLVGEEWNNTIIAISGFNEVINVIADRVNITGFTVNNIGNYKAGIRLFSTDNCRIFNNNISNNEDGIYLEYSNNNNISNNIIFNNTDKGIYLWISNLNNINGNTLLDNREGIFLWYSNESSIDSNTLLANNNEGIEICHSNRNNITNNNASNNWIGIYLTAYSNNNTIIGNNLTDNAGGLQVSRCSNNTIAHNNILYNYKGSIGISGSDNIVIANNISYNGLGLAIVDSLGINKIVGNNISSNSMWGIHLYYTENQIIMNNNLFNDGIFIEGVVISHYNSQNISPDNLVNGKPVYYYKNNNGINLNGITAGQIILANCSGFDLRGLQINITDVGIQLAYSNSNSISCNNLTNNFYGLHLDVSSYNNITDNNISLNSEDGVYFGYSHRNRIMGNNLSMNTKKGIHFYNSDQNIIKDNNIHNNEMGMCFGYGSFYGSNNNNIAYNNITNNICGIYLFYGLGNRIIGNVISYNNIGIDMDDIEKAVGWSLIYHNLFIDNNLQAFNVDHILVNEWDNGYPVGGNYWSDYSGTDNFKGPYQNIPGSDGIGDTPYVDIQGGSGAQDNYPLMEPITNRTFENYRVLKPGWNLISIPLIQGNQNINRVLEMIEGYYDAVQWYDITDTNDPWKHYKVGKPYGNDLSKLNESMGFWIHITQPGDTILLYNGTQPTVNQTISLHPGWNLVGYPSLSKKNRTEALNNISFPYEVDAVWTYNATTQKWDEIGPSDYFELGMGYWVHAKTTCVWEVPL